MILQTLVLQPEKLVSLCAVCISDRNGGQIALLIIISSLALLGVANWVWKKYFLNKILNDLNLKKIRNSILSEALPVKV